MSTSAQYRNLQRMVRSTQRVLGKTVGRFAQFFRKRWKVVLPAFLLLFLIGGGGFWLVSQQTTQYEDAQEEFFEVAFVDARQAVIFWKTDIETIGFVRYGTQKHNRNQTAYQTSSTAGYIHAVVLEELPLEGVYISLHHDDESAFRTPRVHKIMFDEEAYLESYYAQ